MSIEITILLIVSAYWFWLSLAAFNNITDFKTNYFLIKKMTSMEEIIADKNLGNNLQWRALQDKKWAKSLLIIIIAYQLFTSIHLGMATVSLFSAIISNEIISVQLINDINMSFTFALALWFGFLIGGLWFGYWIKMPQVQIVHLILVLITILCITLTNTVSIQ